MPVKERSPHTQDLIERLIKCDENEFIGYDELSDITGRNVRTTDGRWILESAKRIVEVEYKMHFEPVRGQGIRCVINGEQVPLAEAGHRGIARKTVRIGKMLETARPEELSAQAKAAFFATQAWNGTLKHFAKTRTFGLLKKQLVNTRVRSEKDVEDALINTVQAFASGRLRQPKKA